jgi:hypothetical protein
MVNVKVDVAEIKDICKKHGEDMDPLWVNIRREFNLPSFSRSGGIEKRTGVAVSSLFETAIAIPLFLVGTVRCFFSSSFEKIVESSPCAYYRFCQDSRFNWRRAMKTVSKFIRKREIETCLEAKYPRAFIIDDSGLEKSGDALRESPRYMIIALGIMLLDTSLSDWHGSMGFIRK